MSHNIFSKYHALIRNLNTNQLIETLEYNGLGDCCNVIRAKNINGNTFLDLTYEQLSPWRNILNAVQITRLWSVVQLAQSKPTAFLISVNEPQTHPNPANKPSSIGPIKTTEKFPIASALKQILEQKQFGGFPPPPPNVLKQELQPPENSEFHQPNNSYLHTAKDNFYPNQSYNPADQNQGYNPGHAFQNQEFNEIPTYENDSFNKPDQNRGYNVPPTSNNLQENSGYNQYINQNYSAQSIAKDLKQKQNYNPQTNVGYNAQSTSNNLQKNHGYNFPSSSNQGYKAPSNSNHPQQSQNYNPQFQQKQGYNFPGVGKNNPHSVQSYIPQSSINNSQQTPGYNPHSNQGHNHPASVSKAYPILHNSHQTPGYNSRSNQGYNSPSAHPTVNNQRYQAPLPIPTPNTNNPTNNRPNFFPPPPSTQFLPPPPNTNPNATLPRPPTIPPDQDIDDFDSDTEIIPENRPTDSYDYRVQGWYRNISRKEAEALLTGQIDGIFVVRPSRRIEHECTISIMCNHKIYHLGILKRQGKLVLGNSYFDSMNEIVDRFLQDPLVLSGPNNEDIPVILKL